MFRKAYIINFDKDGQNDTFDYIEFHNNLTQATGVLTWWHYLQSSYLIITANNVTATNVADYVRERMPNKEFLVLEVDLKNHNGWLPKKAWDWIEQHKG